MRHWILSTCFLISVKLVTACGGWYPFGEDIRFSLLNPAHFDDGGMTEFYYSADQFGELYTHTHTNDRNVDDWLNLCGGEVSKEAVFEAIYRLTSLEIMDAKSAHPFVVKMRALGKKAELEYLAFAKKYSYLNSTYDDPWERDARDLKSERKSAIKQAKKRAEQTKDAVLQRRYAFLAIRLAFYNGDASEIHRLYTRYFDGIQSLTIDDWARYFDLWDADASAEKNWELAQLFERIPSKRHALFFQFDRNISQSEVLRFAQTDQEKANVLLMYSIRRQDRQLATIQQIHSLNPTHWSLPYLIVRETNKLEDWVLSPVYTAFAPVMRPGTSAYSAEQELIQQGVREDRAYAVSLLSWLNTIQLDAELRAAVTATIQFIGENPQAAHTTLKAAGFADQPLQDWRKKMLVMLNIAADPSAGIHTVDMELYPDDAYRERFLFLIGRLFEFRGELGQAAVLYSELNSGENDWSWFVWADPKGTTTHNVTFYADYFDYFDANYTAEELIGVVEYAKELAASGKENADLAAHVVGDHMRLLDLIGTKFLREENLESALAYFKKVPKHYWTTDDNSYSTYLAANPFYADFYSSHKKTKADTVRYTKYTLVKKLTELLALEQTQTGVAKAKTNFLIANCYFNMTTHGNSWMMRRSWWSTNSSNTVYIDNDEYNECILAKKHYLRAVEASTVDEFAALCLRMAGRCESYQLYHNEEYDYDFDYEKYGGYREYMFDKNTTYQLLEQRYPQWHMELVTNCHSFERFYRSI